MNLDLGGKRALVTGGTAGLGAAISEALIREGVHTAVNFRSHETEARLFAEEMRALGMGEVLPVRGDVSQEEDCRNIFRCVTDQWDGVDILINNAGFWPQNYVRDMTLPEWQKALDINLTSVYLMSRLMLNHLIDSNRRGKILNITSQAAFHGSTSGHAHYAAAKGGVVSFTVSLAREAAAHGINVNALAPGIIDTKLMKPAFDKRGTSEYEKRIPLGYIATPSQIAWPAVFLVSGKADYITGATMDVTGGMLMR